LFHWHGGKLATPVPLVAAAKGWPSYPADGETIKK
jgi:hypothetical protein